MQGKYLTTTEEASTNLESIGEYICKSCMAYLLLVMCWFLFIILLFLYCCCKHRLSRCRHVSPSSTENQTNVAVRNQVPIYSESRIGASTNSAWESYPEVDLTEEKLPTYEEYMQENSCKIDTSISNSAEGTAVNTEIELRAIPSNAQSTSLQTTDTAGNTEDNEELNENPPPPYFPT